MFILLISNHTVYLVQFGINLTFNIYLTFNTYIALIRMRSKRFTSIVLQYTLEI